MTFREKLQKEHPDLVGARYMGGCFHCPYRYEYESHDDRPCKDNPGCSCRACWDREIPGTEEASTEEKPEKVQYNVNSHMYVKLTNYGKELIIKKHGYDYFEACIEAYKKANGYYQLQCHQVMSLFGEYIGNGCKVPFEPTVYFDSADLEEASEEALE